MSSAPFMQVYVADYTADTQHLTCEQDGAYWRLLRAMWRAGGRLPADPRKLAIICGLSAAGWKRVEAEVLDLFDNSDGAITQKRLSKEIAKAREKSEKRSRAGIAGAEAKALKNNKPPSANAEPLPQHSLEPEPEREDKNPPLRGDPHDVEEALDLPMFAPVIAAKPPEKPEPKARRGTRLPEDWEPDAKERQMALDEGLTPEEIDRAAREFRNYWCSRSRDATKLSWPRTWQNRVADIGARKRERDARMAPGSRPGGGRPGVVGLGEIIQRRRAERGD